MADFMKSVKDSLKFFTNVLTSNNKKQINEHIRVNSIYDKPINKQIINDSFVVSGEFQHEQKSISTLTDTFTLNINSDYNSELSVIVQTDNIQLLSLSDKMTNTSTFAQTDIIPLNDNRASLYEITILKPIIRTYFELQEVEFEAEVIDSLGTHVDNVYWISNIDGIISDEKHFYTSILTSGTHKIRIYVGGYYKELEVVINNNPVPYRPENLTEQ